MPEYWSRTSTAPTEGPGAPAPAVTETSLCAGPADADPADLGVDAHTFGELVKLAVPVVTNYHSDLYRDAQWLNANLTAAIADGDALTFWYVVRPSGTHLVQDPEWLAAVRREWPEALTYSVAVVNRRGSWAMLVAAEATR